MNKLKFLIILFIVVLVLFGIIVSSNLSIEKYKVRIDILAKTLKFPYKINENQIYYDDSKIKNVDIFSFETIDGYYSKDKNNIYYENQIVRDASTDTFTFVKVTNVRWHDKVSEEIQSGFKKDKNYIYFEGKKIPNSDSKTLRPIMDSNQSTLYLADKDNVYLMHKGMVEDADPVTYQIIDSYYANDKNNIYYQTLKLEDAHLNSFKSLGNGYARDKYHLYEQENIIFDRSLDFDPFELSALELQKHVYHKNDGREIERIIATYYDLMLFYGNSSEDSVFHNTLKELFFAKYYSGLYETRGNGWTEYTRRLPAFRLAFVVKDSPAYNKDFPYSGGAAMGGEIIGKKLLDENTILVRSHFGTQGYLGPSAHLCKDTGEVVDEFTFKKDEDKWKIYDIRDSIAYWQTTNDGNTEEECTPYNLDKLDEYRF